MENFSPDFFNVRTTTERRRIFKKRFLFAAIFLFALIFFAAQGISVYGLLHPKIPAELSAQKEIFLQKVLDEKFPERKKIVHPLPFQNVPAEIFINAESAIVIDAATGDILFEKNADQEIPPASMTKLVEMFVVFDAVKNGEISLDDFVPLPKESWAVNFPSDASIMFLGENQRVTLRELLLGLSIASGNDASVAVANYVSGDMEIFVSRMNAVIKNLNLEKTHFVESSGYSEKNITTAKEFAAFCKSYVENFPFALNEFHSQKIIRYPLQKNQPEYSAEKIGDSQAVTQYNTNKLLGILPGCDGLKTGFIYESGYNICVTAERNGARYISVTMKGPGTGSTQGNKFRIQDNSNMMEYAFEKFYPYTVPQEKMHRFVLGLSGSAKKSVYLVPAKSENFSVPFIFGNSPKDAAENIQVVAEIPHFAKGKISAGEQFGTLKFLLDGRILNSVPLVADREIDKANFLLSAWGKITARLALLFV